MPRTPTTPPASRGYQGGRATTARATALVLALAWSTVGFATTDLWVVVPPPHPVFAGADAMLEAGWGVTLTCLVVVPLLATVLVPRLARAVTGQLRVAAACTAPVALLALDAAILALGAVLAVTGLVIAWASRRVRVPRGVPVPRGDGRRLTVGWAVAMLVVFAGVPWAGFMRTSGDAYPAGPRNGAVLLLATVLAAWVLAGLVRGGGPAARLPGVPGQPRVNDYRRPTAARPLLVVLAAGAVPWLVYVWHLCAVARGTQEPYVTNGIDHWPQLAAAALTVLVLPGVAAAVRGSVRLAGWSSGLSGVGLGTFSLLYPDVGASLGGAWGAAAVVWGVAVVAAVIAVPAVTPERAGSVRGEGVVPASGRG